MLCRLTLSCVLLTFFSAAYAETIAFEGATVYVSPFEPPIASGTVIAVDGRITAVGPRSATKIPAGARVVDCKGMTLTSGFWNSHVHLIEDKLQGAATAPAASLTSHFQEMLTRYGFAYVFETASLDLGNTLALRKRIESGDVAGPTIYTTGVPFVTPNGTPLYLAPLKLPEVSTAAEVQSFVRGQLARGADGVKFWGVSPNSRTTLAEMPLELARAAVAEVHAVGKLAFVHPTNVTGVRVAAASGVDVLVHTSPDQMEAWDEKLVAEMRATNMALIPTLKLYTWDPARQGASAEMIKRVVGVAQQQLRLYLRAGGDILFGTDVGYVTDYSPKDEYVLMREAGLTFEQILSSLTTAPAKRFGAASRTGTLAAGMDADLVAIEGNPSADIAALVDVQYVYRKGKLLYAAR
jgi:imidazolonepropionase-like amidohydrolase